MTGWLQSRNIMIEGHIVQSCLVHSSQEANQGTAPERKGLGATYNSTPHTHTFLAPRTGSMEDNFSTGGRWRMVLGLDSHTGGKT